MKRFAYILYIIMMAMGVFLAIAFYAGPIVPGTENTALPEPRITSLALQYTYFVLGITILLSLLIPIISAIQNPKNLKRNLMVLVGAAVLFGVSYYFSSGEILELPSTYEGTDNVSWILKLVDMGLFVMYVTMVGAILSIVYSEIRRYLL